MRLFEAFYTFSKVKVIFEYKDSSICYTQKAKGDAKEYKMRQIRLFFGNFWHFLILKIPPKAS